MIPLGPKYTVFFSARATRALADMPRAVAIQVDERTCALASDPRPPGSISVQGRPGYRRIRQGDYRIIYRVLDAELRVEVGWLAHRREVYDR